MLCAECFRPMLGLSTPVLTLLLVMALAALSGHAGSAQADAPKSPGLQFASKPVLAAAAQAPGTPVSINDWLLRMHEGSRSRAFTGTFVVSTGAQMSSARIWHVSQGDQQVELVEVLTGPPRLVYRHNSEVLTFLPQAKLARRERHQSSAHLAEFLQDASSNIDEVYSARALGSDRVAGVGADVVQLVPKDRLRYGYRIWAEQKTGLVVKLQTLDAEGRVLEQAAFSEVKLDAPLKMSKLLSMMGQTEGYRIETVALASVSTGEAPWLSKKNLHGFKLVSRLQRAAVDPAQADQALHWTFSDGLATVSLFLEPFDPKRHGPEASLSMGPTQTLTQRLGNDWVTAMGEVPLGTLKLFVASLERKR